MATSEVIIDTRMNTKGVIAGVRQTVEQIKKTSQAFNDVSEQIKLNRANVAELTAEYNKVLESAQKMPNYADLSEGYHAQLELIKELEIELQKLGSIKVDKTAIRGINNQLKELEKQIQKTQQTEFAWNENHTMLVEKQSAEYTRLLEEQSRLQEQLKELQPEIKSEKIKAQIEELKSELESIEFADIHRAEQLKSQIKEQQIAYEQLTQQSVTYVKTLDELSARRPFDFAEQANQARISIETTEERIKQLNELLEKETEPAAIKALQYEIQQLQTEYDKLKNNISAPVADIMQMQDLETQLETARQKLIEVTETYENFKGSMKEHVRLNIDVEEARAEIQRLEDELDRLQAKPIALPTGEVNKFGGAMQGAQMNARQMGAAFGMALGGAGSLRGVISALSGMLFMLGGEIDIVKIKATAMWAAITLGASLAITGVTKIIEYFKKFEDKVKNTVENIVKNFGNFAKSIFGNIKNLRLFSSVINLLGKSLDGLYKKITNLAKSTIVFKSLQNAVNDVIGVMSDWAGVNTEFNNALNEIKVNLLTAFAPAIEALTPIIMSFMQLLAQFSAVLAQFMAQLFGTSYEKARQNAKGLFEQARGIKAIGEAGAKATGQLPIDEMNKLAEAASGAGTGAAGDMWDFDFTPPDFKPFDTFFNKLKDFFKEPDFAYWFDAGRKAAQKLTDVLRKIPWDSIREGAKAAGENVAGLFGGFFTDVDLSEEIGNFFAQALNTGSDALLYFSTNFPWREAGKNFTHGINTFLRQWEAGNTGDAISATVSGIFDWILGAIEEWDPDLVGGKIGELFDNIQWEDILKKAGEVFIGFIHKLALTLSAFITPERLGHLGTAFGDGLNEIFKDPQKWGDIGSAAANLVNSLSRFIIDAVHKFKAEDAAEALKEAIETFIHEMKPQDIADAINGLVDTALTLVRAIPKEDILNLVKDIINKIDWENVLQLIEEIDEIKKIPKTIFNTIKKELTKAIISAHIGEWIAKLLGQILLNITFPPLGLANLINMFTGWFDVIFDIGYDLIEGLLSGILGKMGGIGVWIKENVVDNILRFVKSLFGIHSPSTVFAEIGGWLIKGLLKGILDLFGSVAEFFGNIFSGLTEFFGGIFGDAWDAVKNIWNEVTGFFGSIWNGITNVFSDVGNWFSKTFTGAKDAISNAFSNIKSWASDRWADIKGAFSDPIGTFSKIGENVKSGFTKGLDGLKEGAKNIFDGAVSGIKNLLGIHSPSTVFADMGDNSEAGFLKTFKNIISSVADIFDSILDETDTQPFIAIGEKIGGLILQGLQNAYDPIMVYLDNLLSSTESRIGSFNPRFNVQLPMYDDGAMLGNSAIQSMISKGRQSSINQDATREIEYLRKTVEELQVGNSRLQDILNAVLNIPKSGTPDWRFIANGVSGQLGSNNLLNGGGRSS